MELVVVVGIIAVLVAILLPVLGKAREQANRVKCAANLRVMGQALLLYTQHYKYYPGMFDSDLPVDSFAVWPVRIRPFLGGNKEVFFCPSQDERCRWTDDGPEPVIRATSQKLVSSGYAPGEPLVHSSAHFSYGYNGFGAGYEYQTAGIGDRTVSKGLGFYVTTNPMGRDGERFAARVRVPEDVIAVGDATADGWWDFAISYQDTPSAEHLKPGRVHSGGANILFCDGHVQWYAQGELTFDVNKYPPAPTSPAKQRMWNYDHRADSDR